MKNYDKSTQYSRVEETTTIKGDIKTESDIRIDGILEGNVETTKKLIIGKGAKVNGKIVCQSADVEGRLVGDIKVFENLNLKTTGEIEGEVLVGKLIVEAGAIFNASCVMKLASSGLKSVKKLKEPHSHEQTA